MTREWRAIKGFEGLYEVSDDGKVRSLDRLVIKSNGFRYSVAGRVLIPRQNPGGYLGVCLYRDGVCEEQPSIHRLVAEAFLPACEGKTEVNHIDGDKTNNNVENLEWCTDSENKLHAYRKGLRKRKPDKACEANKRRVVRSDGVVFESIKAAAEALGRTCGPIHGVLSGRQMACMGFSFKYEDKEEKL